MSPKSAISQFIAESSATLLDHVRVQADGSVTRSIRQSISFSFQFEGATFAARGERAADSLEVMLDADLGPVPYSAEAPAVRRAIHDFVDSSPAATGARLVIAKDQTLRIQGRFLVTPSVSMLSLLTELTALLLQIGPWMRRLAELLTVPSPRTSGR